MSNAWSGFVIILVVLNIVGMLWLLVATSKSNDVDESSSMGHQWDGIEELNNPLPRWWLWLFILTILYSAAYLYYYPGLGNYAGSGGWSQQSEFAATLEANRRQQARYFAEFSDLTTVDLVANEKAMATAERLFLNNCATCHGSDGRGAKGFPNLTDDDWLYGNTAKTIAESIAQGRAGQMPSLGLDANKVAILARYIKSLSGTEVTNHVAQQGPVLFMVCAGCHGADAKGNRTLGAPNLTDDIWLHGGDIDTIETILKQGKVGNMPSFSALLNETEIKLLTAYVLSLGES